MGRQQKYKEYVYRHIYPKKSSALFTYHKHPDSNGGFLDDGICELCGTRGSYILVEDEKPRCCYKCYMKLRKSKESAFDVMGLQKAKYISLTEAKQIIKRSSNSGIAGLDRKQSLGLLGLLLLFGNKRN